MDKNEKINKLKEKLKNYEDKLTQEMKGYRGVIHESAWSENKHNTVMILRDMVESLKKEIENLEKS